MKSAGTTASSSELATQMAKLWPHREHEAASVLGLLCRAGLHRWVRLDLSGLVQDHDVLHCFWCSKVKIDGLMYDA
jgi:hypothetical protein